MKMHTNTFALALAVSVVSGTAAQAEPVWFLDDYEGFMAAVGGGLVTIDFETLPDGSPSQATVEITPEFNYTDQGVTFSPHFGKLEIRGNSTSGFRLAADYILPSIERNWIIGDLVTPARAMGITFVSFSVLSLFDLEGELIATQTLSGRPIPFLGVVSDVPIASVTIDRYSSSSTINSFVHAPVPEPATLALLLCGGVLR